MCEELLPFLDHDIHDPAAARLAAGLKRKKSSAKDLGGRQVCVRTCTRVCWCVCLGGGGFIFVAWAGMICAGVQQAGSLELAIGAPCGGRDRMAGVEARALPRASGALTEWQRQLRPLASLANKGTK